MSTTWDGRICPSQIESACGRLNEPPSKDIYTLTPGTREYCLKWPNREKWGGGEKGISRDVIKDLEMGRGA